MGGSFSSGGYLGGGRYVAAPVSMLALWRWLAVLARGDIWVGGYLGGSFGPRGELSCVFGCFRGPKGSNANKTNKSHISNKRKRKKAIETFSIF